MSRAPRNNKRHCGAKINYPHYAAAARALALYRERHPDDPGSQHGGIHIYQCPTCNQYHLGHRTPRIVRQETEARERWARIRAETAGLGA